ncbi:MAG: hypothetical protein AABM33_04770 [Pseudomonadota bacterium]
MRRCAGAEEPKWEYFCEQSRIDSPIRLEERADQIILIVGGSVGDAETKALREAIAKRIDTRFDAIVIGGHDPALEKLAKDNGGQYISVPLDRLQKWYDEWKKGG